jgi:uncharacterized protein
LNAERSLTPIIKAAGDYCNLRCSYCFYNRQDQRTARLMSDAVLEKFIREYMALFRGSARFIWHGGEPLLAGIDFYRTAVALQQSCKSVGQTVENLLQTNATLITDEWAEFFKEHGFRIGLSIDGCASEHDAFRKDTSDHGSFDRVCRGIEILRRHQIEFGIVQVLTSETAPRILDSFRFFADILQVSHWSINAYTDHLGYADASTKSISNEQIVAATKECIGEWLARNNRQVRIREIEAYVAGVLGKRSRYCAFNGNCAGYFCLNFDGTIYPCDNFTGNPEFKLGDLGVQSLKAILSGPIRACYLGQAATPPLECTRCRWHPVCHNGCPAQRAGGVSGKYYQCEARKELFAHMETSILRSHLSSNQQRN